MKKEDSKKRRRSTKEKRKEKISSAFSDENEDKELFPDLDASYATEELSVNQEKVKQPFSYYEELDKVDIFKLKRTTTLT